MKSKLIRSMGVLVLSLTTAPLFAQAFQGTVRVLVEDPQGAVVAGARVTLRNDDTGETRNQSTTNAGLTEFPNLLVGRYTVTVETDGFKQYVRKNVVTRTNQVVEVTAHLSVGELTETVEVLAGAELVDTTSSQLSGGTFNADQITDLPVYDPQLTGDVTNFAVLAPGVASQPGGVVGQGGAIGGNRPRQNNFVVDGLDNNEPDLTGAVTPVIQDAVAEFTLLTNQFNAEYGHSTAGQFVTTTKSGTNELHGGVWEYNINRHLLSLDNLTRANTPPGADKPRYENNRFGGMIGGPVMRDKLFFFAAYERKVLNLDSTATSEILVPTANGLGTLRSLAADSSTGVSPLTVGILEDYVPTATTATSSVDVYNEATGQLVPIEIGPFATSTPNYEKTNHAMLNTDAHLGGHRLSARLSYYRYGSLDAGQLPTELFNSNVSQDIKRGTLSDVWTVRSNLVNELRAGYTKQTLGFPVELPDAPGATDIFSNYIVDEMGLGIGPVPEYPQEGSISTLQIGNTTTWIRGAHTFKGGLEWRAIGSSSEFLPRSRGEYNYGTLDEFVRDLIPAGTNGALRGVGKKDFIGDRNAFYAFAQDSWRIHPRLTLDLGLRYEYTGVPQDSALQVDNAISNIDSVRTERDANGNVIFDQLSPVHQQLLLDNVGESLVFRAPKADTNNISPRLGFAWDVSGDGRTSVRGGFAWSQDVLFGNLALLQLPPQYQVEVNPQVACTLTPQPAWCANANDVRYSTGGFLDGGGLMNVVDPTTRNDRDAARAQTGAYVYDDKAPETFTWSLSLQRELASNYLVELRYVGTHGRYLPMQTRLNAGVPTGIELPIFRTEAEALSRDYSGAPTLDDAYAQAYGLLEPYGFYSTVTQFPAIGESWYHGLSIMLQRRFSNGLAFNANYTWSHTEDYGENELFTSQLNPRRPYDTWDIASNKGLSGLHKPHKAVLSWQWQIPGPQDGIKKTLLDGWLLTGTAMLESGQALTVRSGRDLNIDFDAAGDRAWENPDGIPDTGTDVDAVCWDGSTASTSSLEAGCGAAAIVGYVAQDSNAQFVSGAPGAAVGFGLAPTGRGNVIGPGTLHTLNLGLFKSFPLGGSRSLRVGVQVVNVTNTPSYTLGSGSAIATNASVAAAQSTPGYTIPHSPQFLRKEIFSGSLGQSPFQRIVQLQAKFFF